MVFYFLIKMIYGLIKQYHSLNLQFKKFMKQESSDQENNLTIPKKNMKESNTKNTSSVSPDFNSLTGQGQYLLQVMKQRGFDLSEKEQKNIKKKIGGTAKQIGGKNNKPKPGYLDGGHDAGIEQLKVALKKAFAKADPQQASCILTYILDKKNLPLVDRNKYGIMKIKFLYGMGAYQDCINKAQQLYEIATKNNESIDWLSVATFSHYIAKSKMEKRQIFDGYMDIMRAKSLITQAKDQQKQQKQKSQVQDYFIIKQDQFADSELDLQLNEITQTELQYNIKMSNEKNLINLITPHYLELRNRKILQIACGAYHTLFLVGDSIDKRGYSSEKNQFLNEVFGIGQNTQGQITGHSHNQVFKTPVLISRLSKKNIKGIFAYKQSSGAFDGNGTVFQWGVHEGASRGIDCKYKIKDKIVNIKKGEKFYAAKNQKNQIYMWGTIESSNVAVVKQPLPKIVDINLKAKNFGCGCNHLIVIDEKGKALGLGDNKLGQLGLEGEIVAKNFKQIDKKAYMGGYLEKVFCIQNCTYFTNKQGQIYFVGQYSEKKPAQEKIRIAEFPEQLNTTIQIGGKVGSYYACNYSGIVYRWEVDHSVKFKKDQQTKIKNRCIVNSRYGSVYARNAQYKIDSVIEPNLCKTQRITQSLISYEDIVFQILLYDKFGPFGNSFILPARVQLFLSTYKINQNQLLEHNQQYLSLHPNSISGPNTIHKQNQQQNFIISQIIQSRLYSYHISRSQQNNPQKSELSIVIDRAGKYYFYILLQETLIFAEELIVDMSEKQKQMQAKLRKQKQQDDLNRKKKLQEQKQQRLAEKKRKLEEQQERRRQTQRRAEDALKKHMKQQEQLRNRIEQQRKRRAELQTGGGFDLSKLRNLQKKQS